MVDLHADFDNLCERYLLGELTESECQEVEKAYFADDSLFERFQAVKEDLLDTYARGNLTGNKLKSFEQHYLASKARRQKVEEARDLIKVVSAAALENGTATIGLPQLSTKPSPKWWQLFARSHPVAWRIGLVAAMLILIAVSWIVVKQIQTARRSDEERARNTSQPSEQKGANVNGLQGPAPTPDLNIGGERATSSPSPSASVTPEVASRSPRSTSAQIASLTLLPLSSRDTGSANSLLLTPETRRVRLNLGFGDARYDSFEISVRTVDGQQVISRGGLKPSSNETGKTVSITFDSSLLNQQDHIATLSGRLKNGRPQTIAEYYFRVQHTPAQSPATPPKQ